VSDGEPTSCGTSVGKSPRSRTVSNLATYIVQRGCESELKFVAGLTDYQIRDLNDEINNLLREKRHFETQIVNLGGANYKRGNASMLDDDGKEVPGTRGYKYFGRARELPGVKEMFSKSCKRSIPR
jgi:hypothetical protein